MTRLDRSIALVLLGAGCARRFGGGKLAAELNGKPLWRWAADAAVKAGFTSRYLVVAPGEDLPGREESWCRIENADAAEGIAGSIRTGIKAAADAARVVIALADMPFVPAAHLRALAEAPGVLFTALPDGSRGSPAAFPADAFPRLLTLSGDRGAASLDWPGASSLATRDEAWLADIDTIQALRSAREAAPGQ